MTLNAKTLNANASANQVELNTPYAAVAQGDRLYLNKSVFAKHTQRLDDTKEFPIVVTQILSDREVTAHVLNSPFQRDTPVDKPEFRSNERSQIPPTPGRFQRGNSEDPHPPHQNRAWSPGSSRETHRQQHTPPAPKNLPPLADTMLVDSKDLRKLRPRMEMAAVRIRLAVTSGQPLLIRFHADADGYAATAALERALTPLLEVLHGTSSRRLLMRAPSKTPFYHVEDALRDLTMALGERTKFGAKLPLLIILDNGSTPEDVLGLKFVAGYGMDIVVIDHHDPGPQVSGRCLADPYLAVHVNPHLVNASSGLSSAILGSEVAHLINTNVSLADLAALGGCADKSRTPEFSEYVRQSDKPLEHFSKLAVCLDFVAHSLRHLDSPHIIGDLLSNGVQQKALMELIYAEILEMQAMMRPVFEKYAEKKKNGGVTLLRIDGAATTFRGEFISLAKMARLMHDAMRQGPTVSIGYTDDMVVFRVDDVPAFDANKLIAALAKEKPYTGANGGGHAMAASLKFVPAAKHDVLAYIEKYVQQL